MPRGQKKKMDYKTEAILCVTNSIRTLKEMVHIKKNLLKGGEFYVLWILPWSKQAEVGWVSLQCLAGLGLPSCPFRRQDPSGPGLSRYPQEPPSSCRLCPSQPFPVCVRGWAEWKGVSHLNPSFLWVCSSEFGWNSCPRYQLLLPEVCEYLWLLMCFLFTMSAALLAFVLIIKTQFIIKTSILWWNWVLRIL